MSGPVTDGVFLLADADGATTSVPLEDSDAHVKPAVIERELVATLDAFEVEAEQFERFSSEMDSK